MIRKTAPQEKLAWSVAWKYRGRMCLPLEDCFQNAYLGFLEAKQRCVKTKTKSYPMNIASKKAVDREKRCLHADPHTDIMETKTMAGEIFRQSVNRVTPERHCIVKDRINKASDEAKTIMNIFLEEPAELFGDDESKLLTKLRGYLVMKGWKQNTINNTFTEIRELIKELA